ncbi:MAG: POTRA domain-containing protein [Candidatus Latescibacterota bacterium]|nr:POTRA domain-containing protein [Candidatus Latescibacterota bacterium]
MYGHLVYLGFQPVEAFAQNDLKLVTEIQVYGNRAISDSDMIAWSGIRKGQPWTKQDSKRVIRRLLEAYRIRGFWNSRVEDPMVEACEEGVLIRLSVVEGDIVTVGNVLIPEALPVPSQQIASLVETRAGDRLIPLKLAEDAEALLGFFEQSGYPFAEVIPEVIVLPGVATVDMSWAIDAGPRVSIDGFRFTGNRATRPAILLRETGLAVGDVFDQRRIDDATLALRQLPWMVNVFDPIVEKDARSGRYVVHFAVEEARSTVVEGAVGLLPAIDGAYDWVGRLHFSSDNLAGSGRHAHLLWERPDILSSDLRLGYGEPWLLGFPLSGDVKVAFEQRPGYVDAGLALGLTFGPVPGFEVGLEIGKSSVRPDSLGGTAIARQSVWTIGTNARLDRRDYKQFPKRGWSTVAFVMWDRVTEKGLGIDQARFRYLTDSEFYRPIGKSSVFGIRFHAEGLFQPNRPSADALVRVGGSRTIRGYREEHFQADHATWLNLALFHDLGRQARAYVFGDGGVVRTAADLEGWVSALGYGVGLQKQTRTGMMTVEYGLSKDDSPGQGKIHVRLAGAF